MIHVIDKNGYIASNLILYLTAKGHDVMGYGRMDAKPLGGTIINTACYGALVGQDNVREAVSTNFDLPVELVQNADKLIHLSSSSEMFVPDTVYAKSKALASEYLEGKATLVYLYTAWGGINEHDHMFMTQLLKAKRENKPFHLSTPYATRDFVHISHICRGIEQLLDKPVTTHHFGMGRARYMQDVADLVGVEYTKDLNYNKFPWRAKDPYFSDTFESDLKEALCEL